jgi:hypothetical protein
MIIAQIFYAKNNSKKHKGSDNQKDKDIKDQTIHSFTQNQHL